MQIIQLVASNKREKIGVLPETVTTKFDLGPIRVEVVCEVSEDVDVGNSYIKMYFVPNDFWMRVSKEAELKQFHHYAVQQTGVCEVKESKRDSEIVSAVFRFGPFEVACIANIVADTTESTSYVRATTTAGDMWRVFTKG